MTEIMEEKCFWKLLGYHKHQENKGEVYGTGRERKLTV